MAKKTLAGLKPNPKNPRTITDKKAKMLRDSLARFGDLSGIVFNRSSGQVVGGHQRIKAFEGLGASDVTVTQTYDAPSHAGTVAEGYVDISGERYAYREVKWSVDEEKAANLAANKGAGEWNLDQVAEWVAELADVDFELDLTMFNADERDALVPDIEKIDEADTDSDDDAVDVAGDPITDLGDLYILGAHRLLCGDSSNVDHISVLMDGHEADMVYTDPPYGMNLQQCNHEGIGTKRFYSRVIGDDKDFDPGTILGIFHDAKEVFLWGADYYRKSIPDGGSWVVWDKKSDDSGKVINGYDGSQFELCWSKVKHQREICRIVWQGFVGLHADGGKRHHPTQKPTALAEWFFDRHGSEGDIVVDLYGGSGSSLLACENKARKCYMMELDPKYCDVIVARWEKMTGQQAKLISSGDAGKAD